MTNPATAISRVLVDELVRCGVTEAVLSPGSWSTPLALALHERDDLRLHVRVDERSASFLAVGIAKASGRPVPVVCTSGTAAANFLPAVTEAFHSGVPIVVLTADRPPELRATGFNQTSDQLKMFGDTVRAFVEVGAAEARPGMNAYWRSLVDRLVARALDRATGGPVHLNVALRKPFLDDGTHTWPESLDGRPDGRPWTAIAPTPPVAPSKLDVPTRGVLLLGDGAHDVDSALRFAERAGWPVIAEPTSGGRRGPNAVSSTSYLLQVPSFVDAHVPEMVITLGKLTLSQGELGRGVLALVSRAGRHVVVDPTDRWPDSMRTAGAVLPVLGEPRVSTPDPGWLRSWLDADATARVAVDAVLDTDDAVTEPRVARDLVAAIGDDGLLFVGSSMSIRDLDTTMVPRGGVRVLTNRGVSGIDGVVSSAMGAALAHQRAGGGPAFALLGDLTLLHDQNGLIVGPDEPRPDLTLVLLNNDGGALFSVLPQAGVGDAFERLFGTPHGVDFAHVAAATGTSYQRVESPSDVEGVVKSAVGAGVRLVEVRTDRAANAALHQRLAVAVAQAL